MSSLIAQHAQWIAVVILFFFTLIISWCSWLTTRVITCATHNDVERINEKILISIDKIRSEMHKDMSALRHDIHEHEKYVLEWMQKNMRN